MTRRAVPKVQPTTGSSRMHQGIDWEECVAAFVARAIDQPNKEAEITDELIEYVLELCEDDYTKGFQRGLREGLRHPR